MEPDKNTNPIFVEPDDVEPLLGNEDAIFVDLCKPEVYAQLHVPGALPLEYGLLLEGTRPAVGKLPPIERLNQVTAQLGIGPESLVIAYDDEGCGRASRLAWTLHTMGFFNVRVINGGIHSWANEGHPVSNEAVAARGTGTFTISRLNEATLAEKDYVLARLEDGKSQLFDSRTREEYTGERAFAARGGHIPGAINLNWQDTIDQNRNMRLKPADALRTLLDELQFDAQREIITYCQTHHRSAHSYLMLKHLGYEQVRGYAGAWSEWGNDPELPVATGPQPGSLN
jgi:thiosulfate/3-mercaptopyruvate sulfurtransferase